MRIPFRCCAYHLIGHLLKDCHLIGHLQKDCKTHQKGFIRNNKIWIKKEKHWGILKDLLEDFGMHYSRRQIDTQNLLRSCSYLLRASISKSFMIKVQQTKVKVHLIQTLFLFKEFQQIPSCFDHSSIIQP